MRIISSFKDYYDINLGYGIDPKLIYVRERKEIPIVFSNKNRSWASELNPFVDLYNNAYNRVFDKHGVIAFCGKTYPFYELDLFNQKHIWFSFADAKAAFKAIPIKTLKREYWNKSNKLDDMLRALNDDKSKWFSHHWDDEHVVGKNLSIDVFRHLDSPVFILEYNPISMRIGNDWNSYYNVKIIVNPILKPYEFMKQFGPVEAFQEISMFIGNDLVKQIDPTVNHSDELKRDIAGFDEWSFRKQSKKRK